GGTPVDPRALEAVGVDPTQAPLAPSQHLATGDTSIPVLSARIPIPAVGAVASFGDLIVAVGLAAAASNITRATTRGGIPVGEILASGPLSIEGSLRSEPGSPVSVDLAPTRPAIRR